MKNMNKQNKELEIEIYKIVDSFLVEAKDQNGNERSLDRLNSDRHLAVEAILKLFSAELLAQKERGVENAIIQTCKEIQMLKTREDVEQYCRIKLQSVSPMLSKY